MTPRALGTSNDDHRCPGPRLLPRGSGRCAALLACALAVSQSGSAGELTVQVSKRGAAKPIGAAAVCLGTPANLAQFGALVADDSGTVKFDNMGIRTPLLLTVSKSGFQGRRIALGGSQIDRRVNLTLVAGGGGPTCANAVASGQVVAATAPSTEAFAPAIVDFRINRGEATTETAKVTLMYALSGTASHYRASSGEDIEAAEWKPLASEVQYELPGAGPQTVYFQVGRLSSRDGADIESTSNVAVDSIVLGGG